MFLPGRRWRRRNLLSARAARRWTETGAARHRQGRPSPRFLLLITSRIEGDLHIPESGDNPGKLPQGEESKRNRSDHDYHGNCNKAPCLDFEGCKCAEDSEAENNPRTDEGSSEGASEPMLRELDGEPGTLDFKLLLAD